MTQKTFSDSGKSLGRVGDGMLGLDTGPGRSLEDITNAELQLLVLGAAGGHNEAPLSSVRVSLHKQLEPEMMVWLSVLYRHAQARHWTDSIWPCQRMRTDGCCDGSVFTGFAISRCLLIALNREGVLDGLPGVISRQASYQSA